jgi:hypothetical protein
MAFDFPLCLTWLYENKGIFFRAMADHAHFQIPVSSSILTNIVGAVDGTRRNCDILLQNNLPVFLYPGEFCLFLFLYLAHIYSTAGGSVEVCA